MVRLHEAALQDPDGSLRVHLTSFGTGMTFLSAKFIVFCDARGHIERVVMLLPAVDAYLTSAQEYRPFFKQGLVS